MLFAVFNPKQTETIRSYVATTLMGDQQANARPEANRSPISIAH
jgi:hypothetical protein